jgi:hypothetical protein
MGLRTRPDRVRDEVGYDEADHDDDQEQQPVTQRDAGLEHSCSSRPPPVPIPVDIRKLFVRRHGQARAAPRCAARQVSFGFS